MINLYASHYTGVSKTFHLTSYLSLTLKIPSQVLFESDRATVPRCFPDWQTLRKVVMNTSERPFHILIDTQLSEWLASYSIESDKRIQPAFLQAAAVIVPQSGVRLLMAYSPQIQSHFNLIPANLIIFSYVPIKAQ